MARKAKKAKKAKSSASKRSRGPAASKKRGKSRRVAASGSRTRKKASRSRTPKRKASSRAKASPPRRSAKRPAAKRPAPRRGARASSSRSSRGPRPRAVELEEARGLGAFSAGQSGDTEGLSRSELADSESVEELVEEGQAFEAGVVEAVENAPEGEVRTREVPEDDVPQEYLDED
jgi:hypothetical protein